MSSKNVGRLNLLRIQDQPHITPSDLFKQHIISKRKDFFVVPHENHINKAIKRHVVF